MSSTPLSWLSGQTFQPRRYRPGFIGNWSGHLPFAHDLLVALQPSLLVELGTHWGESYFGFCQTIAEQNLPSSAYAVDHWQGEPQAGFYDESVFEDVQSYNRANYAAFSYLLRTSFDEARLQFSPDTIDLLHIDGLHTEAAVLHDFDGWLPKVKPGGLILLHDIAARHEDFGVWKLWERLKKEGETFEFHHSWGLGVFRKPGGPSLQSPFLKALFERDGNTEAAPSHSFIRRWYELLALELQRKHSDSAAAAELSFQVYQPSPAGYQESLALQTSLQAGAWNHLSFELSNGISDGCLRLDPGQGPAVVDVRGIILQSSVDNQTLWSATGSELEALTCAGTLVSLPGSGANDAKRFFSYGADPQLLLPRLPDEKFAQPLLLKVWVRVQTDLGDLAPALATPVTAEGGNSSHLFQAEGAMTQTHQDRAELQATIAHLTEQIGEVSQKLQAAQVEQESLLNEVNRQQTRIYLLEEIRKDAKKNQHELELLQGRQIEVDYVRKQKDELQRNYIAISEERNRLQATLDGILRSRSWRITSPIRRVTESLAR